MLVIVIAFCLGLLTSAQWVKEMENPGMYEGDMILTPDQLEAAEKGTLGFGSTILNHWPKQIYYDWAPELANNAGILAALADYEKYTCLRFKKRTTETDYMYFYDGGGCSSGVGYFKGIGRHPISLGSGCTGKGTVLHEIAHRLGIYHEQSRPDRDNYITVNYENIHHSLHYNFKKYNNWVVDSLGTKYDYESVMHYPAYAFSMNGKPTITTKDPSMQNVIGNRRGFSEIDKIQINKMYKCNLGPTPRPAATTTTLPAPSTTLLPRPAGAVLIRHSGSRCLAFSTDKKLMTTSKCDTYFKEVDGGHLRLASGRLCAEPERLRDNSDITSKSWCRATFQKTRIQSDGSFSIQHRETGACLHPKSGSLYPREGNKVVIFRGCDGTRLRFKQEKQ